MNAACLSALQGSEHLSGLYGQHDSVDAPVDQLTRFAVETKFPAGHQRNTFHLAPKRTVSLTARTGAQHGFLA
jgi:hypothetical protein